MQPCDDVSKLLDLANGAYSSCCMVSVTRGMYACGIPALKASRVGNTTYRNVTPADD
jgi:hypothetical protein